MNPRELVDRIRSGPAELLLEEPLRFRRRTRSNSCDFNEFLQALQSGCRPAESARVGPLELDRVRPTRVPPARGRPG
jgi:hypothetical protein